MFSRAKARGILFLWLFGCFMVARSVGAEGLAWEDLGLSGGAVLSLVANSSDAQHLFAIVREWPNGVLYETHDAGLNWVKRFVLGNDSVSNPGGLPTPQAGLCYDPSTTTTLYAGSYTSYDDGAHWTQLTSLQKPIAAVDPRQSNILYAFQASLGVAHSPVYRSENGGQTWTNITPAVANMTMQTFVTVPASAVGDDQVKASTVYLGAMNTVTGGADCAGVWKSTNRGNTWARTSLRLPPYMLCGIGHIAVDPFDANVILALGIWNGGGIYRSDDGGDTWTWMRSEDILPAPDDFFYVAADPWREGVYYAFTWGEKDHVRSLRSTDKGLTWEERSYFHPYLAAPVDALVVDPEGTLYAGLSSENGFACSTDGGLGWEPRTNGFRALSAGHILVHPENPNLVLVSTGVGMFRSETGGGSWTRVGDPRYSYSCVLNDWNTSSVLYTTGGTLVFRSLDSGQNWSEFLAPAAYNVLQIFAAAIDPDDSDHIVLGGGRWFLGGPPVFLVTRNGGATWDRRWVPGGAAMDNVVCMDFGRSGSLKILYAGCSAFWNPNGGALLRSTDGGDTWGILSDATHTGAPHSSNTHGLAVDHANADKIYVGTKQWLFRTTNGGETWDDVSPNKDGALPQIVTEDIELDSTDSDHLYVSGLNSLFESTNGGQTWTTLARDLTNVTAIALQQGQIHYSRTERRMARLSRVSGGQYAIFAGMNGGVSKARLGSSPAAAQPIWAAYR